MEYSSSVRCASKDNLSIIVAGTLYYHHLMRVVGGHGHTLIRETVYPAQYDFYSEPPHMLQPNLTLKFPSHSQRYEISQRRLETFALF